MQRSVIPLPSMTIYCLLNMHVTFELSEIKVTRQGCREPVIALVTAYSDFGESNPESRFYNTPLNLVS